MYRLLDPSTNNSTLLLLYYYYFLYDTTVINIRNTFVLFCLNKALDVKGLSVKAGFLREIHHKVNNYDPTNRRSIKHNRSGFVYNIQRRSSLQTVWNWRLSTCLNRNTLMFISEIYMQYSICFYYWKQNYEILKTSYLWIL